MAPLQFWNDKDTEIVRDADALFKLLWNESELRKNISPWVMSTKYGEYKTKNSRRRTPLLRYTKYNKQRSLEKN